MSALVRNFVAFSERNRGVGQIFCGDFEDHRDIGEAVGAWSNRDLYPNGSIHCGTFLRTLGFGERFRHVFGPMSKECQDQENPYPPNLECSFASHWPSYRLPNVFRSAAATAREIVAPTEREPRLPSAAASELGGALAPALGDPSLGNQAIDEHEADGSIKISERVVDAFFSAVVFAVLGIAERLNHLVSA